MPRSDPPILNLTRLVLRALVFLNLVMGVLIFALLVASLVAERQVFLALGADPAGLAPAMRIIMLVGIAAAALTHILLTRLLAIVDTVGAGDPFVAENAARLQAIAWALLWLELLQLVAFAIAVLAGPEAEIEIDWDFSPTGWLAVLLLFVLARVFDHGARLREDLEGTV